MACHDDRVSVAVWWAAPVDVADAPALLELLDAQERARLGRFRRAADAARFLAAHALTRIVLGRAVARPPADLIMDRTCRCGRQHGKPVLPQGPAFSMTHAGDLVGVAVSGLGPVGLDVEEVRAVADLPSMARHVGAPAEPSGFFRAWTRKEALLKATGDGLASPMDAITLGESGVVGWTGPGAPAEPVWVRDLGPADGYRAAVAGVGPAPSRVTEHDGRPLLAPTA